ncbi:Sulfite dehydrogenase cytochrome subunit SoxD [Candidatus Rhodobacter oscarellae]|uniref:Sulfite dehydrogenase cytochrome subunit SoxD n=1 Tax=Candidatus Rhodobacter oscarellae TaxID=1675527 RepID=A0A0J9H542_9RHOB|nr:c-type cytochrome [Candidatus Rhodobacter lobularis]KMW60698.1 Sulfite dehydrogenase cytochrome subunit SoxD [Candidatus Rhodobacter lobularis]
MRAALIAGLLAAPAWAEDPPEVLFQIEGDVEYGTYLAGECTGCHKPDGGGDGIPAITGWDQETFRYVMHDYRAKTLKNPTMQMIAGRLGDDEIAALSAYFETLGTEGN